MKAPRRLLILSLVVIFVLVLFHHIKSFGAQEPPIKNEKHMLTRILSSRTPLHKGIDSRPNIVYMLADDLGYGDVQYNGGKARTPNLNAMADGPHSIHFSRFYSGGPTCSPTRGTLLTGRHHNRYCIWQADIAKAERDLICPSRSVLPSSELTVAEILKEVGYHTVIYGKWHVGDLVPIEGGNTKWPVSNPTTNGFMDWLVTERSTSNLLPNCKCSPNFSCALKGNTYYTEFCRNYWSVNPLTQKLENYTQQVYDDSDFLVDQFEEFIKHRNALRPFYVQLSFHAVHSPYYANPYWQDYYKECGITSNRERHYLGAVSSLDEAIGRVRFILQKYSLYNNTMLWFSSDNGPDRKHPGSSGGLRGHKGQLFEGGVRVPGIIEWPGVIEGNRKSSYPVVTTDFLPTVASIVGFKVHNIPLDGISILPLLQNGTDQRSNNIKFVFHTYKGRLDSSFNGTVVGNRYKYFAQFHKGKMLQFELFDLASDSSETTNVSSSHIDLTLSMKAELEHFLMSVNESAKQVGCLEIHQRKKSAVCGDFKRS